MLLLHDLLLLVAVAIPVVVLTQRLRIPAVVGFLLTGVAVGPHGLGLIGRSGSVAGLADVAVVLLLFAIGLELSLSRVVRMGRWVLVGGGLQVVLTVAVVALLGVVVALPVRLAIFAGALVALSSTAIVLRVYTDRGELDSVHGRMVVAILLFQDLCVAPLMLLAPALAGASSGGAQAVREIVLSLVVVGALVIGGRIAVPWAMRRVVEVRNREIFTLLVVFCGLGAAFVTARFGLSLALGAFLAGLIISESEYGLQALSDVLPFRDTFSGIFFISVGMLLDVGYVVAHPGLVLGVAAAIIVVKLGIATVVVRLLERSLAAAVVSGLALAQVGEFSFVLAGVGLSLGLLGGDAYQLFLGASVLTMLAAPFLVMAGDRVEEWIVRVGPRPTARGLAPATDDTPMADAQALADHVIIVGYGLNGRNLARALERVGIPYVVLEENGQAVRRARRERTPIHFGDGTRAEVLERVGISRARVIVFAIAALRDEQRGVAVARHLNPGIRIVVRTRYVAEIAELHRLGADEVVPEEFETSIEIFSRVLRRYDVAVAHIRRLVDETRRGHYEALRDRGAAGSVTSQLTPLGDGAALETLIVAEGAPAVGESTVSLDLRRETGASVLVVIRDGAPIYELDSTFCFAPGDEVVLLGSRRAVERAEEKLTGGGAG